MSEPVALLGQTCRWLVCVVMVVAAVGKLRHRDARAGLAHTMRRGLRLPAAAGVVWLLLAGEALTAVGLAVPAWQRAGAIVAAALSVVLAAGAAVLAGGTERYACQCFGTRPRLITGWVVARNAALVVLAGIAALMGPSPGPPLAPTSAAGLVLAVVVAAVASRAQEIARLRPATANTNTNTTMTRARS